MRFPRGTIFSVVLPRQVGAPPNLPTCDDYVACVVRQFGRNLEQLICCRGSRSRHGNAYIPSENAGSRADVLRRRRLSGRRWQWKRSGLELRPEERSPRTSVRGHHRIEEFASGRPQSRGLRRNRVQRRTGKDAGLLRSLNVSRHRFKQLLRRDAGLLLDDRPLALAREVDATLPARIRHCIRVQKPSGFILGTVATPCSKRICHRQCTIHKPLVRSSPDYWFVISDANTKC